MHNPFPPKEKRKLSARTGHTLGSCVYQRLREWMRVPVCLLLRDTNTGDHGLGKFGPCLKGPASRGFQWDKLGNRTAKEVPGISGPPAQLDPTLHRGTGDDQSRGGPWERQGQEQPSESKSVA